MQTPAGALRRSGPRDRAPRTSPARQASPAHTAQSPAERSNSRALKSSSNVARLGATTPVSAARSAPSPCHCAPPGCAWLSPERILACLINPAPSAVSARISASVSVSSTYPRASTYLWLAPHPLIVCCFRVSGVRVPPPTSRKLPVKRHRRLGSGLWTTHRGKQGGTKHRAAAWPRPSPEWFGDLAQEDRLPVGRQLRVHRFECCAAVRPGLGQPGRVGGPLERAAKVRSGRRSDLA
jgi:hypothetical protein